MINFNGILQEAEVQLTVTNRAFLYGDGVFETLKVVHNKTLFFEEHYFRLMASMRIVRMQIPLSFTPEYLEEQILAVVKSNTLQQSARVRLTVFRNEGGYYTPTDNSVSFVIVASPLENKDYRLSDTTFTVDLYKDFTVSKQLLSTLKTNNKMIQITAAVFAQENQWDSCLLINEDKNVIEAINGNLFMVMGDTLMTPPLSEGCLNGIMRKQIIALAKKIANLTVVEAPISPFELQKAEELFITNVITGIQPITQYRKKEYEISLAKKLLAMLNELIEANSI